MKNVRQSTGRFTRILPEPPAKIKEDCDGVEEDNQEKQVVWKKTWTERDDKKLKLLVIESGIMDWKLLSEALEIESDQIKLRWKKVVYPKMIRQSSKVGGSLKWSVLEDKILNVGYRQAINWQDQGRIFLPQRSLGSIEARWRRVAKNFQVKSTAQNKYLARK